MKDNIIIVFCLIIVLLIAYLIHNNSYAMEDVNKDGRVDALDLLIVQKRIIHDMEEDDKNEDI